MKQSSKTLPRETPVITRTGKKVTMQPKTHSMPAEKIYMFKSLDPWVKQEVLPLLKGVERSWQPQDVLPVSSSPSFIEDVRDLRERAKELSDEYLVCLVGDMISEEALPTYQTTVNTLDGVRDESGASTTASAEWTRGWTAEENRHGDAINRYLYLCGRVDMRQVEKTSQYLIGSGMNPRTENNPYMGFVYTSFQERATSISHGNTARMAREQQDLRLAKLCGIIAADEKRHEAAYERIVHKLLELDPDCALLAIEDMMRKKITMPAHFLFDGQDPNLFDHFAAVAQRIGVYTARDYADIVEYLVKRWNLEKIEYGLSGEGRKARDFVCRLPSRIRKLEERAFARRKRSETMQPFSWVFNREVNVSFP